MKCNPWLLKIFHGMVQKKNADLAISCLFYDLPYHTVMFWFSLR